MELIGIYALLIVGVGLQAVTLKTTLKKHQMPAVKDEAGAVIVDTCALIDGRISDLVKAGFIAQRLYVPRRVVEELQYLADHGDTHKRARARFGLDVVQTLQSMADSRVSVIDEGKGQTDTPVDDVLVLLAKRYNAALYTTDYNLNKVARINGVVVLNVNELAHAIRPIHLPGEKVTVKIVQKGESPSQGVGYMEDGTMTVVEGAARRIGSHVSASIDRMLQTEAGKMVFASLDQNTGNGVSQPSRPKTMPSGGTSRRYNKPRRQ